MIISIGDNRTHCLLANKLNCEFGVAIDQSAIMSSGARVGTGSVIIPGVRVGRWSIVGAGSVVMRDIPDGVLACGNRCKIIKTLDMDVLINVKPRGVKYLSLDFAGLLCHVNRNVPVNIVA